MTSTKRTAMVAIILVNFNGSNDTIECISSFDNLTYEDYQIIVIDNSSTDDSVLKLKAVQNQYGFVLLEENQNRGFSAGNNVGIKYAIEQGADYCLLLNNDTIVESCFLEKLLDGFVNNPRCGVTIGKIYYEKQRDVIWYAGGDLNFHTARTEHWRYGLRDEGDSGETFQAVTFASGCCMCIARKTIEKVGLLNESYFLYEEDTEYCFRLIKAGIDIIYVPQAVVYHKVSASTGQASPLTQYYGIRNKYHFIQQYYKGKDKLTAYIYSTLQMIFRCMKGDLNFKYYLLAFKAFKKHEFGKKENAI